ncbi:MAG: DUF58 domain-containing protein [Anaerolineales bacterium]|nr:DUF58 domain-containing protein [Anaerolineales bacterium]
MKKSVLFFIGVILTVIIGGIATLQRDVLVLSIPLIIFLFSAVYHKPEECCFSIQREIQPDHGFPETPLKVKIIVTNKGNAIHEIAIQDVLPCGLKIKEGKASLVTALNRLAHIEIEYQIEAQRGHYENFEVNLRSHDYSGFFETSITISSQTLLVIKPHYPRLSRIKIRPPQTRGFAGPIAARQGGSGIDFFGVREYQSGDPERQINWKIASRYEQDLFTNVYEQERVADVGIVLDARQSMDIPGPSGSLFEYSVIAAASFAEYFLNEGNRVSLLSYGGGLGKIFPGYGRIHKDRILKALARANPGKNYALDNLALLPTRFFPAKSQIVVITPLSPQDIPVYIQMRAHGYAVIVVSPDPVSFEAALYNDKDSLALRMAYAERNLLLQQIQRCGVQVVNWRVDQPLQMAARKILSRQPAFSRLNGLTA